MKKVDLINRIILELEELELPEKTIAIIADKSFDPYYYYLKFKKPKTINIVLF